MIFSHSAFASSLQLTSKFLLTSLRFHFQNQYESAPKPASHLFKIDAQCDIASKTFSRLQKSGQGSSKKPPGRRQGASNSLEKPVQNFKTCLRRLEGHQRRLQDALRRLHDAAKRLQETWKTPPSTPRRVHVACKPVQSSIPYRKMFCNEGYPDNFFDIWRCCP